MSSEDEVRGELRYRPERQKTAELPHVDVRQLELLLQSMRPRGRTFGELAKEWHAVRAKTLVEPRNEERHLRHLAPLHGLAEAELLPRKAEEVLSGLLRENGGPLSRSTVNKIRGTGMQVIQAAIANREWTQANPFEHVRRVREQKKIGQSLTLEEARAFLRHLRRDRWRECVFVLWLGPRPGEIKALRKEDVDLPARKLTIRRSNGRNETKTGFDRECAIPEGLVPVLEEAMRVSVSGLVFPDRNGKLQRFDVKLTRTIRSALKKAGVEKPGFRFYDCRHAAASLLTEAGCHAGVMKVTLGWSRKAQLQDTYVHLTIPFMKAELEKLKLLPENEPDPEKELAEAQIHSHHARTLHNNAPDVGAKELEMPSQANKLPAPSFPSLGSGVRIPSAAHSPPEAEVWTAREAAEFLRCNPASIRRMCIDGRLPSFRIGRDIRVRRADVLAFAKVVAP